MNPSFNNASQLKNELPILTKEEFNEFWKTRRRAMHPLNFLWIMIGELTLGFIFALSYIPEKSSFALLIISSILLLAFFYHMIYVLITMVTWRLFLNKNFPPGVKVKEAIALREASRKLIQNGHPPVPSSYVRNSAQVVPIEEQEVQLEPLTPTPVTQPQYQPPKTPSNEVVSIGTRRQRREAQKKASPFAGLKDKATELSAKLLPEPPQSSISNYGIPLHGRNEELARLNQMDPLR